MVDLIPMRKDIRDRWLDALRGSEYTQGASYLNREGKMCCLGVLCDLATKDGCGAWVVDAYGEDKASLFEGFTRTLPEQVREWAGLSRDFGDTGDLPDGSELAGLNDVGTPFADIADIIEKNTIGV